MSENNRFEGAIFVWPPVPMTPKMHEVPIAGEPFDPQKANGQFGEIQFHVIDHHVVAISAERESMNGYKILDQLNKLGPMLIVDGESPERCSGFIVGTPVEPGALPFRFSRTGDRRFTFVQEYAKVADYRWGRVE